MKDLHDNGARYWHKLLLRTWRLWGRSMAPAFHHDGATGDLNQIRILALVHIDHGTTSTYSYIASGGRVPACGQTGEPVSFAKSEPDPKSRKCNLPSHKWYSTSESPPSWYLQTGGGSQWIAPAFHRGKAKAGLRWSSHFDTGSHRPQVPSVMKSLENPLAICKLTAGFSSAEQRPTQYLLRSEPDRGNPSATFLPTLNATTPNGTGTCPHKIASG
jgi:hypothetical protein